MSHDYHPALPGYVKDAVFHSGCPECEHRAGLGLDAIRFLDAEHLRNAMARAHVLEHDGMRVPGDTGAAIRLMVADPIELPFLRQLALVSVVAERLGWAP